MYPLTVGRIKNSRHQVRTHKSSNLDMENLGVNRQTFYVAMLHIFTSHRPPLVIKPGTADRREVYKRNNHKNVVNTTEDARQCLSLLAETEQVELSPKDRHQELKWSY